MQQVLDIRQARAAPATAKREADQARRYWEARKRTLGITRDVARWPTRSRRSRRRGRSAASMPLDSGPWSTWTRCGRSRCLATRSRESITRRIRVAYDHLAPTNQVRFRTEREAQQAGYRRASKTPRFGEESGVARTRQERQVSLTRQLARLLRSRRTRPQRTATSTCGCMPRNANATGA